MPAPARPHNRKPIKPGARLPYWERAGIDPAKLKDYALNPDKPKHKGFALLGYQADDWQRLNDDILSQLTSSDAVEADLSNPDRLYFTVRISLHGPNGRPGVIVTGWCVDARREPWLATLYAQPL